MKDHKLPLTDSRNKSWNSPLKHSTLGISTIQTGLLVAQTVSNTPAMRETWTPSLGWEDPLEEGMATHSSILAWKSLRTEEPGGLQSMGLQRVRHD